LIGIALASCVSVGAGTPAEAVEGTLTKIKERGAIVFGHREASPPFSFLGDDKKPTGYAVELCLRIATAAKQQLGLESLGVRWVPVTPADRLQRVADGLVDLECGSTTVTLSRQEQVDFSNLIFVDGGGLLVKRGGSVTRLGDLGGKRVAVARGTTTEHALADALKRGYVSAQVVLVADHAEGLAAVEQGTAHAYASDRVILAGLILSSKDRKGLAMTDDVLSYEPYALVLRRNDADFRLLVNRTLARIYRSGGIGSLLQKWFGAIGKPTGALAALFILNAPPE
jgi:glutamate/aspartate transport system substrate-binding protein